MIKRILILLLIVLLGGLLGELIHRAPSYAMLSYDRFSLEMSLWVLLLLLLALCMLWSLSTRFMRALLRAPQDFKTWQRGRRTAKANKATLEGVQNLFEGNWKAARNQLAAAARHSEVPLLNFLGAARAAHALGRDKEREKWLEKAARNGQKGEVLVALNRAEVLMEKSDRAGAMEHLTKASEIAPDHPGLVALQKTLNKE